MKLLKTKIRDRIEGNDESGSRNDDENGNKRKIVKIMITKNKFHHAHHFLRKILFQKRISSK